MSSPQPSSLILALQHAELLDPTVRAELEQFAATLQNWASKIQAADGSIYMQGMGTFIGQPCVKLQKRATQSIPNGTLTIATWDPALTGSPIEECDDLRLFDGSQYVILDRPGTYYAQAEIQWATNAAGLRFAGIYPRLPSGLTLAFDYKDGSAVIGPRQVISAMFQVIQDSPLGSVIVPFPLSIGVQVYQTSGGPLNIGAGTDRLCIWKVS